METGRPVIVTPGSNVAALGFIRSLGERGVRVTALAENLGPGLLSKYCTRVVRKGLDDPSVLVDSVARISLASRHRPILLPASDGAARTISIHKEVLERHVDVPLSGYETLRTILSKRGLHGLAERSGVPQPLSSFPESSEDVLQVARQIGFPCLVKPDDPKGFFRAFGVKGWLAKSSQELLRLYALAIARGVQVFVQEYIPGEVTSNYGFAAYFDRNSRPHGPMTYRRIAEWPPGSPAIAAMAISVDEPELLDEGRKLFSTLGFHGIVQAEFKRDPRDQRWKVLDANPRAWTSNRLATECGQNLPIAAHSEYSGAPFEDSKMTVDVKWMNEGDAFFSFLTSWRRGDLSFPDIAARLRGKIVKAIYDGDDLRPFSWLLLRSSLGRRFAGAWRTPTDPGP